MPKTHKPPEPKKNRHITLEERVIIEDRLNHSGTIADIAAELKRSISTISREIKNHTALKKTRKNDCVHKNDCKRHHVCGDEKCLYVCRKSKCVCKERCPDYQRHECPKLRRPPYVCNGCNSRHYCDLEQNYYSAKKAHAEAEELKRESHAGFDLTLEQFATIDEMVSPLLKKGQSVYHVVETLGDTLFVSESTLRRLIDSGELSARNIDLRNKVKLRPRKKRVMKNEQALNIRKIGHLWEDFNAYMTEHDDICVVEMDCVEGCKTSKNVLLTLHWVDIGFQIAILMPLQTSENVVAVLDTLEAALGTELFTQLFPVILTDNGTEFTAIEDMERSYLNPEIQRTKLFFCEPNRANEKGECENNHKYIRYIIPKGTDLDMFTQEEINLCMSHVNSFKRKKVLGQSPAAMAKACFPEEFFTVTGIREIPPTEVHLLPSLLGLVGDEDGNYTKKSKPSNL